MPDHAGGRAWAQDRPQGGAEGGAGSPVVVSPANTFTAERAAGLACSRSWGAALKLTRGAATLLLRGAATLLQDGASTSAAMTTDWRVSAGSGRLGREAQLGCG